MIRKLFFISLAFISTATAGNTWKSGPFELTLDNGGMDILFNQGQKVDICSFAFNFIEPDTITIKSIQTDTLILTMTFDQKDGFHNHFPDRTELTIARSGDALHFTAGHDAFRHCTVRMNERDEHYFGLIEKLYPGNLKSPDLRGNVVDVDVYGLGNLDFAENYCSAYSAFYISSKGYGSFFDTFEKGRYHLAVNGKTEIYHRTGKLDWYLFFGSSGTEIHRQYFNVIGKPKHVPIWALGPVFWRDQNDGGKDEVLDDIIKMTELKIPLTACWVDRPYSDGNHKWSKMNFSRKFSNPEKWIKSINEDWGLQFMTWVASATFGDRDFPGLFPDDVGYMDLTSPEALKEFEARLNKHQYAFGVRGHKMDRADEHFPLTARWHERTSETATRNKYIYLFAKTIDGFLTRAHGDNHFNFARAAFHRTQPYLGAVWGGDSRSNWQGMAGNQANAMRCSFMGFPVWGTDTGGYLGEGRIDETLYIRWLQWGAWNGMFEIKIDGSGGSGNDRAPWHCSEQLQQVFREVCEFRMQLLPTIYSLCCTSHKNGVLMKPLAYGFLNDTNTYSIWDEYMFGNTFLVAPLFSDKSHRSIYLPEGKWIDLFQGDVYKGPITIVRQVPINHIPVFIRQNSVYITGDIYRGNSRIWKKEDESRSITIHLYPGQPGSRFTFDYVDILNSDRENPLIMKTGKQGVSFTADAFTLDANILVRCQKAPSAVTLGETNIPFSYNDKTGAANIQVDKNMPIQLMIQY